MKTFIILVLLGSTLGFPGSGKDPSEKEFEKEFDEIFDNSFDEENAEKELEKEEESIDYENELYDEGKAHFKEGIHQWDDEDSAEFDAEKNGALPEKEERGLGLIYDPNAKNTPEELAILDKIYSKMDRSSFPTSWDSRAYGWVTPVKNQGSCGSCASFASGGAMEICLAKAGAPTSGLDIAEQQLLDCAYNGGSANGCNGAYISAYPKYIAGKQVIHENSYPYMDTQSTLQCQNKPYWNAGAKIDTVAVDYNCDDDKIKYLIQTYGSAVVGLYASDYGFKNYVSGVFDTCSYPSNNINHAVLAMGWGTENGIDFWLIKNSWGESFGASGYIKVKRGTCGVQLTCAALACSANGSQDAIPAPSGHLARASCDVNCMFGEVTGLYRLNNGGRSPLCNCAHGKCSPHDPNIPESCPYICGKTKCC